MSADKRAQSPQVFFEATREDSENPSNKWRHLFGWEARGIERVPDEEKTVLSVLSPAILWTSTNFVLAAFSLGAISYSVYNLDFRQAVLTITFFNLLGSLPVGFFSIFGARFGLRQMVLTRFFGGVAVSKVFAAFNTLACVGWTALNTISSAQLLHIVNHGALPEWGGCIVVVALTMLITFFGYGVIQKYDRWSWIPNAVCFAAILGCLVRSHLFDPHVESRDNSSTTAGHVLSFSGAILGMSAGWTTCSADYTVYMPANASAARIFTGIASSIALPLILVEILGAASITVIKSDAHIANVYAEDSIGGLVHSILAPLHGFGSFLCVLLALSTVCNNIPNMYSIGLTVQSLSSALAKIRRVVWTVIGNSLVLAVAIPAYYHFEDVIENIMDISGYYVAIYIGIGLVEHCVFRGARMANYAPETYTNPGKLNPGWAGSLAFASGVAGAVLGMNRAWYQGVVAAKLGVDGGDVGFWMALVMAAVVYLASRGVEKRRMGR